ncbi:MAG TPA: ABC transporter ATP-binding protein [Candidatus Krumholzibacteria bacterium]|nr:ABC transporter ATP-binding protein [Candidatus Krumholzibacteria bacterium]
MIEVSGLSRRYGSRDAVVDISFSIPSGEIVGFLGPNGAGKTTTLRMLTGYLPPTAGTARVAGHDILTDSMQVRRHIGYLPESVPLYRDLTVTAYLDLVATLKGMPRAGRREHIAEIVESCGLTEVYTRRIGALSRGYRQRTGLAQALVGDPDVLFLDEPTVGLDPRQIVEIRELIRSLAGRRTIMLSTHILPEVGHLCQRVLIIHRGRLVSDGPPDQLQQQTGRRSAVEIEARGEGSAASAALSSVAGVTGVEIVEERDGIVKLRVHSVAGEDPREAIASALADARISLRAMTLSSATLEDVFMQLVTREEAP